MPFDVEGAKKAGYSDAEIADYLAKQSDQTTKPAEPADYADVPGGGGAGGAQPQPGAVAASREAWRDVVDTSIQPGPDVADMIPASRDPATGRVRLALPNPVRAILTEAPGGTTPGIVNDPVTGAPRLTPEMQAAGSMGVRGGRPLEIQPTSPSYVPPGTLNRRAPLSPEFRQNPLGPSLAGREMPTPSGPTSSTGVPPQTPMPEPTFVPPGGLRPDVDPTKPFTYNPPSTGWPAGTERWAGKQAEVGTTERPGAAGAQPKFAPGSDEAILAHAESVANQHYDVAKTAGPEATYTPQSVGKMVDAVDRTAPQGPGERAVGGENAVTRLQTGMQQLRDKSLTLADVQRMDERMSDLITEEYKAGRNKVAQQLEDIQQDWREQADTATAADVTGGEAGFHALSQGRGAWTQVRKMRDVINMKERTANLPNPTTSYKTAVNTFVNGRKSRGWTAEEKADLVASADRGVIGTTLHVLGSRLLPHVGGTVGASVGGIPGFIAGEVVTHGLGAVARTGASNLMGRRVNRIMGTLSGSVPAPPTNELLLR